MGPKVNSPRGEKVDTTGLHTPRVTSPRGDEGDTTGLHNPRVTSPRGEEGDTTGLHTPRVTSPRGEEVDTTGLHNPRITSPRGHPLLEVILVKATSFTSVQTTTSISEIIMDPRITVTKQTRTTRRWVRWGTVLY